MRIGLGTAQFGLDYGITNKNGQILEKDAHHIIELAHKNHIFDVDTAPAYGNAEMTLGNFNHLNDFRIITKTVCLKNYEFTQKEIGLTVDRFKQSLINIGKSEIYGLLIHDTSDTRKSGFLNLLNELNRLKSEKLYKKLGVTVYSLEDLDWVTTVFKPDLIQIPLNVLNQHFLEGNQIKQLKEEGVEIHARSVFLQGLLLSQAQNIPKKLSNIGSKIIAFNECATSNGTTTMSLAIDFLRQTKLIDVALVGVTSVEEFLSITSASQKLISNVDWDSFKIDDQALVNPNLW